MHENQHGLPPRGERYAMKHEPHLPRAVSLSEMQLPTGGGRDRNAPALSLRNIVQPLQLPGGVELISLTTFDGRLVILTSKGPYIRRDSSWEKVLASQPDPKVE